MRGLLQSVNLLATMPLDTWLLLCILTARAAGYVVDTDEERRAEQLIDKEAAAEMRRRLAERGGEGYGSEWILIPDGSGTPQRASLQQPKFFGFGYGGEGRDDSGTEEVTEPPERHISEDVHFTLYTRNSPEGGEPITVEDPKSIEASSYDPQKPTKVIVHGWKSSGDSDTVLNIKNAYLSRSDMNVVAVDWSPIASSYYYLTPASDTVRVGRHVGRMVDVMAETRGARHDDFHLIGHSLGAHVAGAAGSSTSRKVSRVTGLDPALPGFQYYEHAEGRLDEGDAEFVEVIHTCSGALGMSAPAGHADFYPNGGSPFQPGCCCVPEFTEACSHGRAHKYFAESIINDTPFEASQCSTWDEFKRSDCAEGKAVMGEHTAPQARGVYYLMTNSSAPYSLGSQGARYSEE